MKETFIKLHISILLAGFTGLFGKWISLSEGLLVCYRMFFASAILFLILWIGKTLQRLSVTEMLKIGGTGFLLGLHWVFFYGSIKASNVSIGVVCFSLVGFFTAILEPLINRHKVSARELIYSLFAVLGIILIFQFDTRYRTGILLGIISTALAAMFTIVNKRVGASYASSTMLLYEMSGGFLGLLCLLPVYLLYYPVESAFPNISDLFFLLALAFFCTVCLYLLQIQVLKAISAFTVNLSYNLEPVYSIILAMIFFKEAKELNSAFYVGLILIICSVLLQTMSIFRNRTV